MTVKTGYYEGGGSLWGHGEVPECDVCGESAKGGGLRATNTSGVNICWEDDCAISHCNNQFTDVIELVDDGKAPCIDCEEPTLPVEHGWVIGEFICGGCISDYEWQEESKSTKRQKGNDR